MNFPFFILTLIAATLARPQHESSFHKTMKANHKECLIYLNKAACDQIDEGVVKLTQSELSNPNLTLDSVKGKVVAELNQMDASIEQDDTLAAFTASILGTNGSADIKEQLVDASLRSGEFSVNEQGVLKLRKNAECYTKSSALPVQHAKYINHYVKVCQRLVQ